MARLTARERREAYLREYSYQKKTGKPFFPNAIFHDIVVNLFFVLLIVGLAILWHATANGTHSGVLGPLYEDKADSAVAIYDPRPDWYYFFLFQLLRVFSNPNLLLLGTIIIPSIWMGILITLPFIDRTRERRISRRPIAIGFAGVMMVLLLTLTWKGSSAPNIGGTATATGPGIAFVKQQSCGSCHTLKAMGWGGNIGPSLDSTHPNVARAVTQITNGGAPMPSFKGTLTTAQIKCVATVVATLTNGGSTKADQAAACKGLA
jgi:quinol---cytochrome c reductase cytochrome c subunit, bacillus type